MEPTSSQHPENPQATPKDIQNPQEDHVDTESVRRLPDRTDRPSPYGVQWRVDGERKKLFYATPKARDEKFRALEKAAKRGTLNLEPTRDDLRDWIAFRRATAPTPWQDVVAGWRESGRVTCTRTIKDCAEEYIKSQEKRVDEGTIVADTLRHQRTMMLRFSDAFGSMRLGEPTPEAIEEWIDDLGFESRATFNSYLKLLRAFYTNFKKLLRDNPASEIRTRDDSIGEVQVNTVAELAKLFAYSQTHHPEALGRLALESFAGLRFSSSYRLEKHDINFAEKGILLPRHKLKTKRRRYIQRLPENLWLWLEATNDACWAMQDSEWMHLKSDLFRDAKVPHPHNSLRHSFATHHMSAHASAELTAYILCHRSQDELWEHYNGCATEKAGKLYFTITPQSAAAIAVDPTILALIYPKPSPKHALPKPSTKAA